MLPNSEIKKALREAGLEVYRTQKGAVHVAERVRENLIMDSGVRIRQDGVVVLYTRAQRGDFPGEVDDHLFARARRLGEPALAKGYREVRTVVTELTDPGEPNQVLDHWCEVQFEKTVETMAAAINEVRFAYGLDKVAGP